MAAVAAVQVESLAVAQHPHWKRAQARKLGRARSGRTWMYFSHAPYMPESSCRCEALTSPTSASFCTLAQSISDMAASD